MLSIIVIGRLIHTSADRTIVFLFATVGICFRLITNILPITTGERVLAKYSCANLLMIWGKPFRISLVVIQLWIFTGIVLINNLTWEYHNRMPHNSWPSHFRPCLRCWAVRQSIRKYYLTLDNKSHQPNNIKLCVGQKCRHAETFRLSAQTSTASRARSTFWCLASAPQPRTNSSLHVGMFTRRNIAYSCYER